MTSTNNAKTAATRPLTISRAFAAPRERVFACWSSAERMKRWFSPEGVDVPEAEIDFRPGGAFVICMRLPDGTEHWCRGAFGEIVPPEKLTFDCEVSAGGKPGFFVRTLVLFANEDAGARMTVEQSYEIYDDAFRSASRARPKAGARRWTSWSARSPATKPRSRPPFAALSRSNGCSRRRRRKCSRRSPTRALRAAGSAAAMTTQ